MVHCASHRHRDKREEYEAEHASVSATSIDTAHQMNCSPQTACQ